MTGYFLDSSALVKRYVDETGSDWIRGLMNAGSSHEFVVAAVTRVEVAAAFAARFRARPQVSPLDQRAVLRRFLQDCDERCVVIGVIPQVIGEAVALTQRYRLRGYDAVQLASALVASRELVSRGMAPLVLVSADSDLLIAAAGEDLAVENPLDHLL
ncbi:MAG: type II toxin-antitoxin system VapC family toxin [Chloroflexota bacterium]